MKLNSNKFKIITNVVFFVMGLLFLLVALGLNYQDYKVKNEWITHEAIIIRINHSDEIIKISYSYDGQDFNQNINYYSSLLNEGDSLKISINPIDYTDVYVHDMNILFIVFYIVGAVFLILSISLFLIFNYKKRWKDICLEHGKKRTVDVLETKKTHFYYNNYPYYCILVSYNNVEYKSELFLLPKDFSFINDAVVDLYIHESGKYYIDINSYREKIDIFDE